MLSFVVCVFDTYTISDVICCVCVFDTYMISDVVICCVCV